MWGVKFFMNSGYISSDMIVVWDKCWNGAGRTWYSCEIGPGLIIVASVRPSEHGYRIVSVFDYDLPYKFPFEGQLDMAIELLAIAEGSMKCGLRVDYQLSRYSCSEYMVGCLHLVKGLGMELSGRYIRGDKSFKELLKARVLLGGS